MKKSLNARKVPGALVWHQNEMRQITSQCVGPKYLVLENRARVKRNAVRLVKKGDKVAFKDEAVLPERCRGRVEMQVAYILDNGLVGTDKDLYPDCDSTSYGHFKSSAA